jgi:iron complex outermembrane receptor protein
MVITFVNRLQAVLLLLVFLVFPISESHAQSYELNTVVVTATRFDSEPDKSPVASQLITADDIQFSSANTLSEVLNKLGGVHTRTSFTGIPDAAIDLRGFGASGDQNTLILLNGQRLSENEGIAARLSSIPLNAIDRIEILRGSGSVLYGGGATSGVINILTKSAQEEGIFGSVSVNKGSFDLQDQRANLEAKNGELRLMLNAQKFTTDNYRLGNEAKSNAVSGEIKLGKLTEFLAFEFLADDQISHLPGVRKINLVTGVNEFLNNPRGITTPLDYLNSNTNQFAIKGERKTDGLTFAIDIGWRNKSRQSFGSFETAGTSLGDSQTQVTTISPRILSKDIWFGKPNKLSIGIDWADWRYENQTTGTISQPSLIESASQQNMALYVRDEWMLSKDTKIDFGLRSEKLTQDSLYSGHDNFGNEMTADRSVSKTLAANEIAINHQLTEEYLLYARAGQSFRLANVDENRCGLYAASCASLIRPQISNTQEIGFQWTKRSSMFSATLFNINISDEIHYNAYTGVNTNLSPTQHRGLELEAKIKPTGSTSFSAKYAYTQAFFKEGLYSGFDGDLGFAPFTVDLKGKNIPLVPRNRLSMNAGWQIQPLTRINLFLNYVGSQQFDNDQANNFKSMPSFTTVDLKLAHQWNRINFSIGINNLFDKAYFAYGVTNLSLTPSRYNVYPEARRNGYASMEYRF